MITPEMINELIGHVQYHRPVAHVQFTICSITLTNGFTVVGTAGCADPDLFDATKGEQFSLAAAKNEIAKYLAWCFVEGRI